MEFFSHGPNKAGPRTILGRVADQPAGFVERQPETFLVARRQHYAELEQRAVQQALASGGQSLGTSDVAMAAGEDIEKLRAEQAGSQSIRTVAGTTMGLCGTRTAMGDVAAMPMWNGWGASLENTHFQKSAQAGLTAGDVPTLHLLWAFGFPDTTSAWAQPTVAGGRLFVGSQNGTVYSLDAASGCIYWSFRADAGVRTAVVIGKATANHHLAYFGDVKGNIYGMAGSGQDRSYPIASSARSTRGSKRPPVIR